MDTWIDEGEDSQMSVFTDIFYLYASFTFFFFFFFLQMNEQQCFLFVFTVFMNTAIPIAAVLVVSIQHLVWYLFLLKL